MQSGKGVLWSSDLLSTQLRVNAANAPVSAGASGTTQGPAPSTPDPVRERAYLRYAVPGLEALRSRNGVASLDEIATTVADRVPDFDFDDLRRAIHELTDRGSVALREVDKVRGNHLYEITATGERLVG
jgi:hypothetical protein